MDRACSMQDEKPQGKRSLLKFWLRREYNFKTYLKETELWTGTEPAYDRIRRRTFIIP
jgi:hypothetical protein